MVYIVPQSGKNVALHVCVSFFDGVVCYFKCDCVIKYYTECHNCVKSPISGIKKSVTLWHWYELIGDCIDCCKCYLIVLYFSSTRVEEMCMMVGEVSEKVIFIQDGLSELDCQLGQLQDLSALAVDTLTLLSASDSLHQEEARLAQCRPITASQHILSHSCSLPHRSGADCDVLNMRRVMAKSCKSTPPSLLKGCTVVTSRVASQECHVGARGGRGRRQGEGEEGTKEVLSVFF